MSIACLVIREAEERAIHGAVGERQERRLRKQQQQREGRRGFRAGDGVSDTQPGEEDKAGGEDDGGLVPGAAGAPASPPGDHQAEIPLQVASRAFRQAHLRL